MRCTDTCRLIGDTEIHDAALWRLDGWTPDEIEAGSAPLATLVSMCPELDASHRSVAKVCQRLQRPGDRRDPWTALCALVCLWAGAHADLGLFHRAGFAVLASRKQAERGHHTPAPDALDELMTAYLQRHPETTAQRLFEHCQSLAPLRWVVQEASDCGLTYLASPAGKLKLVRWGAFKVRVSRIHKKLESMQEKFPACAKRTAPANTFHWPSLTQPVVVTASR